MNNMIKLSTAIVAGALSLGALSTAPAQAAPAQAASAQTVHSQAALAQTAFSGAAMGCAKVEHWTGRVTQSVRVTNNCGYTISFQVKRRGPDPRCTVLTDRHSYTWQWTRWGGQWQGIRWNCA
ncbi:hypothetical protein [Streptosporangium sp. NPDC051022]|uniref:hypothetical protein n=1 Tax=Streptosporangium sp. NPDC051022 TaxID=3155752 RepID=UPI00344706D5